MRGFKSSLSWLRCIPLVRVMSKLLVIPIPRMMLRTNLDHKETLGNTGLKKSSCRQSWTLRVLGAPEGHFDIILYNFCLMCSL